MSKINIQIYKPFGSSISMQDLPFELMKDFREDLKMIQELPEEKKKNYWFGYKLAGGLGNEGEFLITPDVMYKWKKKYFDQVITYYTECHYPEKKVERIIINSAWHNFMLKNQWNPIHTHSAFTGIQDNPSISVVGYIEVPKQMNPINGAKPHYDFSGCVEWREGTEGMFQYASYKRLPKERQFFVFPANLQHMVYPHSADKPRISFSFNAVIKFKNTDDNK